MRTPLAFLLTIAASAALANHPGERLDQVTAQNEPAFEATGSTGIPRLVLQSSDGAPLGIEDLDEQIVVLSFQPPACGAPCAEQQAALASVQESIAVTPMREMVTFLTVRAPGNAPETEWDGANWQAAAPRDGDVAKAAERFAELSTREPSAPMAHVIDRNGRHAGIFHGAAFAKMNMVLYINGLSNAHPQPDMGFWQRVRQVFE